MLSNIQTVERNEMLSFSKNAERRARFNKVVRDFEKVEPHFAAYIFKIGSPTFTEQEIETAAVAKFRGIGKYIFLFNSSFFDTLDNEQLLFVVSHEAMHVAFDHLNSPLVKRITKIENPVERDVEMKLMNVATDAVINDILVKNFPNMAGAVEGYITGEGVLGYNVAQISSEKVYSLLDRPEIMSEQEFVDKYGQEALDNLGQGITSQGGNGKIIVYRPVDEHIPQNWNGKQDVDSPGTVVDEQGEIPKDSEGNIDFSKLAGTEKSNAIFEYRAARVRFSLNNIINKCVSRTKHGEDFGEAWHRRNKKVSAIYGSMGLERGPILPDESLTISKSLPKVLFCIDVSGSINYDLANKFVSIARNHADEYDCIAVTFDTQVFPFKLKSQKHFYGGGGTCFEYLVQYVNQKVKHYDIVFVLTDGYGGMLSEIEDKKKWYWVLTPDSTYHSINPALHGEIINIPSEALGGV